MMAQNCASQIPAAATSHTAESVLQLYAQISGGGSRQQRDAANLQILQLQESQQAWYLALELLSGERPQQAQFIGAQILFKKLENHFDQIEKQTAQVLEVRDKMFEFLPQTYSRNIVLKRLCMGIALLAIQTTKTCWQTSIDDIIKHGSASPEQCYVALVLLMYMADMHSTHCHDQKSKHLLSIYIRENLPQVQAFFTQVLQQQNLPQECYNQVLSASNYWCKFSTTSFVMNQQFVACLLQQLHTPLFPKVTKVIRTLLTVSKFAKSIQHCKMEDAIAMKNMTADDRQFISNVVDTLIKLQPTFLEHPLTNQFSEDFDDDPAYAFPRKYVGLLVCLCTNYEILMVTPHQVSDQLFKLIKDCAKVPNLRLSVQSLDFWTDFKETMNHCGLCSQETLLNQYKEVSQILLGQSLLLHNIPYESLQLEEIEELEVTEKGISMIRFREYSADILLKTYLLLQSQYQEKGEQVIYGLLTQGLEDGIKANQAAQVEVCYFAARAIYDGFDDTEWNQVTLQFIRTFFAVISQYQIQTNFCLIRTQMQLIAELANSLVEHQALIGPTLNFCYQQAQNERLRTLAIESVLSICEYCFTSFTETEIQPLFSFLNQTYEPMSCDHTAKLVRATAIVASVQEETLMSAALEQIAKLPLQNLLNVQSERQSLLKASIALRSMIVAISDLPKQTVRATLTQLFTQTWPTLQSHFQIKATDQELIVAHCDLLLQMLDYLPEATDIFMQLQQTLLQSFAQHPKQNTKCLLSYSQICLNQSQQSDKVKEAVLQTMDSVCEMLLPIIIRPELSAQPFIERIEIEVVTAFAVFLTRLLDVQADSLPMSRHFPQLMDLFIQTCINVSEPDLTTRVITLFQNLIEKANVKMSPQSRQAVTSYYLNGQLVAALISVIPYEKNKQVIITKVSQCFVFMCGQVVEQGRSAQAHEVMGPLICKAFDSTQLMQTVPQTVRQIVYKVILVFYNQIQKVKLLLQNLQWYIAGEVGEDAFLGMELQAQQKLREQKATQAQTIEL